MQDPVSSRPSPWPLPAGRPSLLARLSNAGFDAVSQDIALELGEDRKHTGQCASSGRGQVECFREGHNTDIERLDVMDRTK